MNPTCNWKTILFGSVCASILSLITVKVKKLVSSKKQSDTINEVLLYGAGDAHIKKQLGLNNLLCVYYVLVHARQTVDVCMPTIDSDTISKCLIKIHQKSDIIVRIVVHKNTGLNLKQFMDYGIEVKVISKIEIRLEHEFILIDAIDDFEDAIVIIGSLDYEVNHVNSNTDSTLMTSEKAVVSTLKGEFDRIWRSVLEIE